MPRTTHSDGKLLQRWSEGLNSRRSAVARSLRPVCVRNAEREVCVTGVRRQRSFEVKVNLKAA